MIPTPTSGLRLHPPAKLNLFLHILGRREDGYHRLQTAFELIDWYDELILERREDGTVERLGGPSDIPAEADLTVRAARLLQAHCGSRLGCRIALRKTIPSGAGLGGGSADAAAVLLGLDRLWQLSLPQEELLRLALQLGADVPVFIGQEPCFAEGLGERMQPLPFARRHYAVVFPGEPLATATMFRAAGLRRDCSATSLAEYLQELPIDNVFEPVARLLSPGVGAAVDWLQARFGNARLSGSGSACFAAIQDQAEARALLQELPAGWQGRVVSSIHRWFDKQVAEAGK